MYLDRKHVLLGALLKQLKIILEVDEHRLGRDFMSGVGLGIEWRGGTGEVHRFAPADLLAVQVGNESVIVLDMQHQVIHLVGILDRERMAQIDRGVLIPHVTKGGFIVVVTVANTHSASRPLGFVETWKGPVQCCDHVLSNLLWGGFFFSLEITPHTAGLELVVILVLGAFLREGDSCRVRERFHVRRPSFPNIPPGKGFCQLLDVILVVTVIDPEPKQLKNFSRVIFVRFLFFIQHVVEINEHRGTSGAMEQKIPKVTECVVMKKFIFLPLNLCSLLFGLFLAHGVSAIRVFEILDVFDQFVVVGGKVVFPELTQNRLKLAPRINAPQMDQLLEGVNVFDSLDRWRIQLGSLDQHRDHCQVIARKLDVVNLDGEHVGALLE